MKRKTAFMIAAILLAAVLCAGCSGNKNQQGSAVLCTDPDGIPVAGTVLRFCTDSYCQLLTADSSGVMEYPPELRNAEIEVHSVPEGYSLPEENSFRPGNGGLTIVIGKQNLAPSE